MPDDTPPSRAATARAILPWINGGILLVLALFALRLAQPVAVPLVFGLFIAVLAAPADRYLAERLPRGLKWLGRLAVIALLLGVLAVFFAGVVFSAQQLVSAMPAMSDRWTDYLASEFQTSRLADNMPPALAQALSSAGDNAGSRLATTAMSVAQGVAGATGAFVASLVIVFFLVLLALSEAPTWRKKLPALCHGPVAADECLDMTRTLSRKLRAFLMIRAAMGVIQGALYVAWIALFGVDLLLVWGVLTFRLTFIPTIGSIVSGILPVAYALLTRDLTTALALGAGLFAIEQTVGNWIDPKMQGRQIAISPVVVLVSILLWGWIWGIAGALLAVPMTIAVMVVCAHVQPLRPLALILSDQTHMQALDDALAR